MSITLLLFCAVLSKTSQEAWSMPSSLCVFTSFLDWWPRWNNGWWKVRRLIVHTVNTLLTGLMIMLPIFWLVLQINC
jgi:hypothetical protein